MRSNLNNYISLFFILFIWSETMGQVNIQGQVQSKSEHFLEGVIIKCYAPDTSSLIKYAISKQGGKWELTNLKKGNYVLLFSHLGYEDYYKNIHLNEGDSIFISATLQEKVFRLEDVTVKAPRLGIVQKGDTLFYDLNAYKSGAEKDLGDLLNQLPGLEVSANGEIKYNGKRVDKLLIEKKDILNDQHKLTTEGFEAVDIAGIQIIQNYKPFSQQFSEEWSDKVALNVELTEKAKGKLKGNIQLDGGYEKKAKGAANLFNIHPKFGFTSFLRGNNTGELTASVNDWINMQSSFARALNQTNGNFDDLVPNEFHFEKELRSNKDFLISVNGEYDWSENAKSKISILGSLLNRNNQAEFIRTYPNNAGIISGINTGETMTPFFYANFNHQSKLSKKTTLELELPFNIKATDLTNQYNGSFINNGFKSFYQKKGKQFDISPQIYFRHKINERLRFGTDYSFSIKEKDFDHLIEDSDLIFGSDSSQLNQHFKSASFSQVLNFKVDYKFKKFRSGITQKINFISDEIALNNTPVFALSTGKSILKDKVSTTEIRVGYLSDKWWIQPKLAMVYNRRAFNNSEELDLNWFNCSAVVRYNFSKLHFILLSYGSNQTLANHPQINRLEQILDNRTLTNGEVSANHKVSGQNLTLSYFWFNIRSRSNLHSVFSYSNTENPIITQSVLSDNYIEFIHVKALLNKLFNWNTNWTQRLSKFPLTLKMGINFSKTENDFLDASSILLNTFHINAGVNTSFKKPFNINVGYGLSKNEQIVENIATNFKSNSAYLKIIYQKEKIHIENEWRYNINRTTAANSFNFIDWDFEVEYDLSDKFSLTFVGQDILNLKGVNNISVFYSETYIEQKEFIRFPGNIRAGVLFRF